MSQPSSIHDSENQVDTHSDSAAADNQPNPADAFEVLLITGMSGAGRSRAADSVEDMGWYVVDNLPPKFAGSSCRYDDDLRVRQRRSQARRSH